MYSTTHRIYAKKLYIGEKKTQSASIYMISEQQNVDVRTYQPSLVYMLVRYTSKVSVTFGIRTFILIQKAVQ